MAYVPVPNVLRTEFIYSAAGQIVENVIDYRIGIAVDGDVLQEVGAGLWTSWNTHLKATIASDVQLLKIKLTDLSSESGPATEFALGMPISGTVNSPAAPNNVTVAVKLVTALRGRSYRGRKYHVGLPQGWVAGSRITPATAATIGGAWDGMRNVEVASDSLQMVVVSKVHNGVPRSQGVSTLVSSIIVNQTLDSQRRRLPERGT